eukprot:m.295386 g.295386  ORF g.295386 m.295386 type:complete len:442 (-) comp16393_c6_seq14:188-1513(-)
MVFRRGNKILEGTKAEELVNSGAGKVADLITKKAVDTVVDTVDDAMNGSQSTEEAQIVSADKSLEWWINYHIVKLFLMVGVPAVLLICFVVVITSMFVFHKFSNDAAVTIIVAGFALIIYMFWNDFKKHEIFDLAELAKLTGNFEYLTAIKTFQENSNQETQEESSKSGKSDGKTGAQGATSIEVKAQEASDKKGILIEKDDLITVYCPVQSAHIQSRVARLHREGGDRHKKIFQQLSKAKGNTSLATFNKYVLKQLQLKTIKKKDRGKVIADLVHKLLDFTMDSIAEQLGIDPDQVSQGDFSNASWEHSVYISELKEKKQLEKLQAVLRSSTEEFTEEAQKIIANDIYEIALHTILNAKHPEVVPLQYIFDSKGQGVLLFFMLWFEPATRQVRFGFKAAGVGAALAKTNLQAGVLKKIENAATFKLPTTEEEVKKFIEND